MMSENKFPHIEMVPAATGKLKGPKIPNWPDMPKPVAIHTMTWPEMYRLLHGVGWNDYLIKRFIPHYWRHITDRAKRESEEHMRDSLADIVSETVEAMMEANNRTADGELKTPETHADV